MKNLRMPIYFRNMFPPESCISELEQKYAESLDSAREALFNVRLRVEKEQAEERMLIDRIARLEREKAELAVS